MNKEEENKPVKPVQLPCGCWNICTSEVAHQRPKPINNNHPCHDPLCLQQGSHPCHDLCFAPY
jgi:hypothetical protein